MLFLEKVLRKPLLRANLDALPLRKLRIKHGERILRKSSGKRLERTSWTAPLSETDAQLLLLLPSGEPGTDGGS